MKLKLSRFSTEVEINASAATVFQIEERNLFSRVVASIVSEKGLEAAEPYELLSDDGKTLRPKGALYVVSCLPTIPLEDKALLAKLYERLATSLLSYGKSQELAEAAATLFSESSDLDGISWGSYSYGASWDMVAFFKTFKFKPFVSEEASLLDRCIAFFELCVDAGLNRPVVLVNAKSFFGQEEVEELYRKAIFNEVPLLLLESWKDDSSYDNERKYVIDQDLYDD